MTEDPFHRLSGSQSELMAFARYWRWERSVREQLPIVLRDHALKTVYQPLFRIEDGDPVVAGGEALARFPTMPNVPVGLWFRTAREMGLGEKLESLAIARAVANAHTESTDRFLNVNASASHAVAALTPIVDDAGTDVVVDIACRALLAGSGHPVVGELAAMGVALAVDDAQLDRLHDMRSQIEAISPQYLKVDVVSGLFDDPMGRFNLSEAAAWCRDLGIVLVAERVESPADLEILYDIGVDMAQGFSLAPPAAHFHELELSA